jgi:hypothetical protein
VNCADFPRRFYHQDPNVQRTLVTVPGKSVHWFPGIVQFGIIALPFKGHNLPDKGHTKLGRMPMITLQCWRRNMSKAQRTRTYAGPHVDKYPIYYRPYRMNQYLSSEDRFLEHQHHNLHQSNLLRVGGSGTTAMSGEAAVKYLAINALAQAYEQQFELGNKEEEEENDHSDDGNSEATNNRKPAAEGSKWMVDEGKLLMNHGAL